MYGNGRIIVLALLVELDPNDVFSVCLLLLLLLLLKENVFSIALYLEGF